MTNKEIKLDPETFATAVVSGSQLGMKDDLIASKAGLKRYLTAYLLAEDFNQTEAGYFNQITSEELDRLFSKLKAFDFNKIG